MARKKRIHRPGSFYHVMLRGNDGQDIFFSDGDRCKLCHLIQEGVERYEHTVHAYCFMSNHVHLVIQTAETPLSRIVQNLSFRYASYINRKYDRVGHLFQGRFKAILVAGTRYLLRLIRYVHLNPVAAGLIRRPEQYLWSSHKAYLGLYKYTWIRSDFVLDEFATQFSDPKKAFHEFVLSKQEDDDKAEFEQGNHAGQILAPPEIAKSLLTEAQINDSAEVDVAPVIDALCERMGISREVLSSRSQSVVNCRARGLLCLLVRNHPHAALESLVPYLKRSSSTLSRLASTTAQQQCCSSKEDTKTLDELVQYFEPADLQV